MSNLSKIEIKIENKEVIKNYIIKQLNNVIPEVEYFETISDASIEHAIVKTEKCLKKVIDIEKRGSDYLNSGNYSTLLYFLSKNLAEDCRDKRNATRVFLLNKAVNGLDLFYEINMPENFLIAHTVGMVFAKAIYGNFCVFHQGCTVGRNRENRPILEPGVIMYPNSAIIGKCLVKSNTVISPGVSVINKDTPGNCIVFGGRNGRLVFKDVNRVYANEYFNIPEKGLL